MSEKLRKAVIATLCIDVARSTSTGLAMRQNQRFEFQKAIIDVMMKYYPSLGLREAELKMTGDGWLIFSPTTRDWQALVILAKTLCVRYQTDVQALMTIPPGSIPGVRTCICTGFDMEVLVPRADGTKGRDWIGDSARRASRFSNCPAEGELYVDQNVYDLIHLQFATTPLDFSALPPERKPKRDEELRPLWIVGDVHTDSVDDADDPGPYLHFLNWTGRTARSAEIVSQIHENVTDVRSFADDIPGREERQRAAIRRLRGVLEATPADGPRTSLIDSLTDLGMQPDVFFFSKRIRDAVSYRDAEHWYEEMKKAGVTPNEVTTATLAKQAPDFSTAQALTDRLRAEKAFRGRGYYGAVFAKVPTDADPIAIIDWYFQQDYRYALSLEPVIPIFSRAKRDAAAMEFVVRWPQLPAAQKFMRDKPDEFLREITRFVNDPEMKPSALYALGIFHVEQNEAAQALAALREALTFPTADARRRHIDSLLAKLDHA
ncbi:MAG: hypothetical protein O6757_03500 [Alphaproteobacteria bacterium]|nr:hypothetical protein [Alphaproteobacteria bacterium]